MSCQTNRIYTLENSLGVLSIFATYFCKISRKWAKTTVSIVSIVADVTFLEKQKNNVGPKFVNRGIIRIGKFIIYKKKKSSAVEYTEIVILEGSVPSNFPWHFLFLFFKIRKLHQKNWKVNRHFRLVDIVHELYIRTCMSLFMEGLQ